MEKRILVAEFERHLKSSLLDLQNGIARPSDKDIQEWAALIYNSMATSPRLYHDPEHITEVLNNYQKEVALVSSPQNPQNRDPISILAILFHDIVYITLDQRLSTQQSEILKHAIMEEQDGELLLLPFSEHKDPMISMVATVFDMKEGEHLPELGKNEFLSALIAAVTLEPFVSGTELFRLVVGIEATVPFRPIDQHTGKTPMDRLYDRAWKALQDLDSNHNNSPLSSQEEFVCHAVQQAVIIANSDLGTFGDPDPTTFIDSNWRLFPEWFPSLLGDPEKTSVVELQTALSSILKRDLDIDKIFPYFRGVPSTSVLEQKRQHTRDNQDFLRRYISIRLLTVTLILELITLASEEDSSSLLSSSLSSVMTLSSLCKIESDPGVASSTLQDTESKKKSCDYYDDPLEDALFQVLTKGRGVHHAWDSSSSLLSAYIFVAVGGSAGVSRALEGQTGADLDGSAPTTCINVTRVLPKEIVLGAAKTLATVLCEGQQEVVKILCEKIERLP